MATWNTIGSAPKDKPVLLWVTRFATMPAGQSEAGPVVGRWNRGIAQWKVEPETLNHGEVLYPSHWMQLPEPPNS